MIIADTSPLNYLILIDAAEVLPKIFQKVIIPTAVQSELLDIGASEKVQKWIQSAPNWLEVEKVDKIDQNINLGLGEVEVISLAVEISVDLILLDDKAARLSATQRNLQVIGTLGVLKLADEQKFIDFEIALKRLQKTNFRASKVLLEALLNRDKN
ncbi:DUF3368 domain-containing protein [soil metagenome]